MLENLLRKPRAFVYKAQVDVITGGFLDATTLDVQYALGGLRTRLQCVFDQVVQHLAKVVRIRLDFRDRLEVSFQYGIRICRSVQFSHIGD